MKSSLLFEVETPREMLKASIDALDSIGRSPSGLTKYGQGYRDSRIDVLVHLNRILEEVKE